MTETALATRPDPAAESMALVKLAMADGVDVDKLERVIAMRDADVQRRAVQAFHDAMTEFHKGCPTIPRNRTANIATRGGTQFQYQYADLDSIQAAVDPLLRQLGLRYTWDTKVDGPLMTTTCKLSHADGHEVASSLPVPTSSTGGMSDAQRFGAANTYSKRLSLVQVLGLAMSGPDVDGADVTGAGADTITEEQATTLLDWLRDTNSNTEQFLAWAGVEEIADLPASKFEPAMGMLRRKMKT